MAEVPVDPRWPKLMSLSVHELRSPLTVVSGYVRMLIKDRAGPLTDQQRRLLEETAKSCTRLSELLAEASDVAHFDDGQTSIARQRTDLGEALRAAIETLPPLPEREVPVRLDAEAGPAPIDADSTRLTKALRSIVAGVQRELIAEQPLVVRERRRRAAGREQYEIAIGEAETLALFDASPESDLPTFDEWRGGCGLSLPLARRVLNAHGGQVLAAPDGRKSAALIRLPVAS